MLDSCLEPGKIEVLKMLDLETKSAMKLVWGQVSVQATNRSFSAIHSILGTNGRYFKSLLGINPNPSGYFPIQMNPLPYLQREVPIIFYFRYYPTSTNYNKPWDGLTASKGYTFKKRSWGWNLKGFSGVRASFQEKITASYGAIELAGSLKMILLLYFWYHNVAISSAKSFDWFLP